MSATHSVDDLGRYDGRSLREAVALVVDEVVEACDPRQVILFGSVARGDDGPDSDIDLLVVFDELGTDQKITRMREVRGAISTFAPVDVTVIGAEEFDAGRDDVGSVVYWPVREGRTMYQRSAVRAS